MSYFQSMAHRIGGFYNSASDVFNNAGEYTKGPIQVINPGVGYNPRNLAQFETGLAIDNGLGKIARLGMSPQLYPRVLLGTAAGALTLGGLYGGAVAPSYVGDLFGGGYGRGAAILGGYTLLSLGLPLAGAALGKSVLNKAGGITGVAGGLARGAGYVAQELGFAGKFVEKSARNLLANPWMGIGKGNQLSAMDAWFPFMKIAAKNDLRRYLPNPKIGARLGVGLALLGAAKGALSITKDSVAPQMAPPTIYYDGFNVRHINDMGADSNHAQRMLGRNSRL